MNEQTWMVIGLTAVVWAGSQPAQAEESLLAFDLPAASPSDVSKEDFAAPPASKSERLSFQLPAASAPAPALESPEAAPVKEPFRQGVAPSSGVSDRLPVPPVMPPQVEAASPLPDPPAIASAPSTKPSTDPPAAGWVEDAPAAANTPAATSSHLFAGGADSLVAKAVGSAEGTRTPDGLRTAAYYGHVDPGNGAWNVGSFSYQHGAASPEMADTQQLQRLQAQAAVLRQQASDQGLQLTLAEELNGIDLANQAPQAALDRGYIDWLLQARSLGMAEDEAILWARTRAFLDPDSGRWNAPGLGNTVHSISQDQARRQRAIATALAASQFNQAADLPPLPASDQPPEGALPPTEDAVANAILSLDLEPAP